ncbi:hypothetical protein QTO30_18475 [Yoonia sp. GPGPB17]|uniref:hypothetical protein n=1 Tax=Yoonia sp. GPGPB17 TaxID=3026147 RepID=UPI0030BF878F
MGDLLDALNKVFAFAAVPIWFWIFLIGVGLVIAAFALNMWPAGVAGVATAIAGVIIALWRTN